MSAPHEPLRCPRPGTLPAPDTDPEALPGLPSIDEYLEHLAHGLRTRDPAVVEHCLTGLFHWNPRRIGTLPAPLHERARRVHEAIDRGLREVLLADAVPGRAWEALLLPDADGSFGRHLWLTNALWLRLAGSAVVDRAEESSEPAALAELPLPLQARRLGRLLVANDGARAVDVAGLLDVLDPRLRPVFTSWVLAVHLQSPGPPVPREARAHQERARAALEAWWADRAGSVPVLPHAFGACYYAAYAGDRSTRGFAELVHGRFSRALFDAERTRRAGEALELELPRGGQAVLSSHWRESHVVHRCMGPLLEGRRAAGAVAIVPELQGAPEKPLPQRWAGQTRTPRIELARGPLAEYARLANAIRAADLELLVFPEVGLTNDSAWLATQRLARVQVSGYGHPVTSGSPHLDYFVGGTETEGPHPNYAEQLVLIPGIGFSTTTPPEPRVARTRPWDDERVRVLSLATPQKLHHELLDAWEAILGDRPRAALDLYPNLPRIGVERLLPRLGRHLRRARVTVHPRLPREELTDRIVDCDLFLDTFPYGGFNTLVEVLATGCPAVTLEGHEARNRTGAAALRRVGLPEWLIARDWPGYVAAARRLIDDAGLRAELRAQLGGRARVLARLADPDAPAHFEAALAWMLERGPRAGRRPGPPVLVEAG